ncbi:DUF1648 domain-containing protein [Paenibacillus sp. A14]|uniref:DUF1648 domain-containing protein n=1 Tax=Paenibacillus sp. A14 TaxID=3119820 RepID=UPI002FE2003B
MQSKLNSITLFSMLIAMIPFGVYFCYYSQIPQTIPIHFNDLGVADRFVNKASFEVLLLCGLGLIGFFIMKLLSVVIVGVSTKNRKENSDNTRTIMDYAALFVTVLFVGMSIYYIFIVTKSTFK